MQKILNVSSVNHQYIEPRNESELMHKQLIAGLDVAVYLCDKDGFITMFNDAAVQLWGRVPEIGKDLWCGSWRIYNTDGSEMPLNACPMAVTLKTGIPIAGQDIIVERPDGVRRNILPHPKPLFNSEGEIVGAMNMLLDITEQMKTKKDLKGTEQHIEGLNNSLEQKVIESNRMIEEVEDYAIIFMDREGNIQNWNKGAEKIKGYKEEEILGKNFRIFYMQEDRDRGLPEQLIAEAVMTGRAAHEGWRLTKYGEKFWGSIVITALHDELNNVIGFTKLTRNLTERKLAEDKLQQNASELEAQNKELEQFTYLASHDMKEPLRKIILYNNLLRDSLGTKLEPRSQNYLERSLHAANRMQRLIEDLLTYSKTSLYNEEHEKVDLNTIVADVVDFYNEKLEDASADVKIGSLPVVNGISFQLRQLFDNIISNAIKYRKSDVDLLITIDSELVSGSHLAGKDINTANTFYKISVADNGMGFSEEYSQKVFELFQRLVTKEQYSGNGIGLSICKKIMQNHKGFIEAISTEGEGATFNIYLPKAKNG